MYAAEDDAAELAAFGFLPDDYADETLEIWPENEESISLFSTLSTQWRVGMSGPTGLDYTAVFARMDRLKFDDEKYERLFQDIRVIEGEALSIFNSKTKD